MNNKKILAAIDFSMATFDIYWGLSYNDPISLVLAAFLVVCGITLLKEED